MDIYKQIAISILKITGLSTLGFIAITIAVLILIYLSGLIKSTFCAMFCKKADEKEPNDEEASK